MDFSVYEAQLHKRMLLYGILCLIVAVVCIVVVLYNYHMSTEKRGKKPTFEERFTNWFIYILGVGGLVGSLMLGTTIVRECAYDIKHEAYIVWEGDITVYRDGPSKGRWYIPDEEGIKLEGSGLEEGKYTGKIVYAEKSKIVLDYNVEETQ